MISVIEAFNWNEVQDTFARAFLPQTPRKDVQCTRLRKERFKFYLRPSSCTSLVVCFFPDGLFLVPLSFTTFYFQCLHQSIEMAYNGIK